MAKWPIFLLFRIYDLFLNSKGPNKIEKCPGKIVVTELTRIGDVLMATPAIRSLKMKYPHSEVIAVVQHAALDMLSFDPFVDVILSVRRGKNIRYLIRLVSDLRKYQTVLAVSISPSIRNAIVTRLCGAKYKVGYLSEKFLSKGFFDDHIVEARGFVFKGPLIYKKHEHLTVRACKSISPLGVECEDKTPHLYLSENARKKATDIINDKRTSIVIHPTSGWYYKSWPKSHFVYLINMLFSHFGENKIQIILIGSDQDATVLEYISQVVEKSVTLIQGHPLALVAAVIMQSDLFVGNDSGPLHIAGIVNTRFVGIFGPSDPKTTGPLAGGKCLRQKMPCSPCGQGSCLRIISGESECMRLIEPQVVFRAALHQLKAG